MDCGSPSSVAGWGAKPRLTSTQTPLRAEGGHCWVPEAKLFTVSLEIRCHSSDQTPFTTPILIQPVTLFLPTLVCSLGSAQASALVTSEPRGKQVEN